MNNNLLLTKYTRHSRILRGTDIPKKNMNPFTEALTKQLSEMEPDVSARVQKALKTQT